MKNDLFNLRRFCRDGTSSPARRSGQHLQEESIGKDNRVLRGGSWNNNTEINLRSSYRNNNTPRNRNDNNGFRCVLSVGNPIKCLMNQRELDRRQAWMDDQNRFRLGMVEFAAETRHATAEMRGLIKDLKGAGVKVTTSGDDTR